MDAPIRSFSYCAVPLDVVDTRSLMKALKLTQGPSENAGIEERWLSHFFLKNESLYIENHLGDRVWVFYYDSPPLSSFYCLELFPKVKGLSPLLPLTGAPLMGYKASPTLVLKLSHESHPSCVSGRASTLTSRRWLPDQWRCFTRFIISIEQRCPA